MVGEAPVEAASVLKPRKRNKANYSEKFYERQLHQHIALDGDGDGSDSSDSDSDEDETDEEDEAMERGRWGGTKPNQWKKSQALTLLGVLEQFGYRTGKDLMGRLSEDFAALSEVEIHRMAWSLVLLAFCEQAKEDASAAMKREERKGKQAQQDVAGDSLGKPLGKHESLASEQVQAHFLKNWAVHRAWASLVLNDAVTFVAKNEPRIDIERRKKEQEEVAKQALASSIWSSLEGRGWKKTHIDDGVSYQYRDQKFKTAKDVLLSVPGVHPELQKMIEPILAQVETSIEHDAALDDAMRSEELGINATNISYLKLRNLLSRHAPLQLFHTKSKSLPVGRRVLSACGHMHSIGKLLEKADENDCDLKKLVSVDSRATLPHPQWTVDHDVTLLIAIAKHGWIDRDKACKAIVNDESIHWGFPFEELKETKIGEDNELAFANLQRTGERAGAFLEDFQLGMENLKGCDKERLEKVYCLEAVPISNGGFRWRVKSDLLKERLLNLKSDYEGNVEDLPTKKDMAKRAKLVIQKAMNAVEGKVGSRSRGKKASKDNNNPSHGFTTIDQGNPCFVLLTEILKSLIRGSFTKNQKLLDLVSARAYEEALALNEIFKTSDQVLCHDLSVISEQISLARKCTQIAVHPAKNLYRVMVGIDPLTPKVQSDPMFPSKEYVAKVFSTVGGGSGKTDTGANGDRAILRAMKKARDQHPDGSPVQFVDPKDCDGLQLSMDEALLLVVFCGEGIPLSTPTLNGKVDDGKTWDSLYSAVTVSIRDALRTLEYKYKKLFAVRNKLEKTHEGWKEAHRKAVAAEWESTMTEAALRDLEKWDTSQLAFKSAMLLERIRVHAFSSQNQQRMNAKADRFLGNKVVNWMRKELKNWLLDLDCVGPNGIPKCVTAESYFQMKPELKKNIYVGALLDKKSAREIFSQVALLTRLRSLILEFSEDEWKSQVASAHLNCQKRGDNWERQPKWWKEEIHCPPLLSALNEKGFTNVLSHAGGFDGVDESRTLKDLNFTKTTIQMKCNLLVRELHLAIETQETLKLIEKRRKDSTLNARDSLAALGPKPKEKTKISEGGIQTGIHSFFGATKTGPTKTKVVHDLESFDNSTKRKDSPASDRKPAANKKAKKSSPMAPIFLANTGKRKEGSVGDSGSEQSKNIRKVINESGENKAASMP